MVRICDELRKDFEYILIDSPAGIERGFKNAIAPADVIVIVTNPEVSAVRDADRIIGIVEAEQKGPAKLVINRINMDMVERGDMLAVADVLELLAVDLIGIVPEDQAVLVSTNRGAPIALEAKSKTGQAFRDVAKRLAGQEVTFTSSDGAGSLFGRLSKMIRVGSKHA
jgi:septum site-determining protein MinD